MYVNEFNELRKRTYLQLQILSLSGINRNEGTLYVGNMIPGVTFESIKDHPTATYSKAVEELVNERVSSKSESITVHAYLWKFLPRKACVLICVHLTCFLYLVPQDLNETEVQAIERYYKPKDPTNETEMLMSIGELYGDVTYKCPVQELAKVSSWITIFPPTLFDSTNCYHCYQNNVTYMLHCVWVSDLWPKRIFAQKFF